jgi:hypothetical protein
MIDHLSTLVENFPGAVNRTRCFTHILNLEAKSILRSFDAKKKVAEGDVDDGTGVLAELAWELELEDDVVDTEGAADDDNDNELDCEDDEDGLGDGRDGMSEEEVDELDMTVVPVRLMLTKVSHFKLSLILSNPTPT